MWIGAVLVLIIAAGSWWIFLRPLDNTDDLKVTNDFADATCMAIFEGPGHQEPFSVRKGETIERRYDFPRDGFVDIGCDTALGRLESPGHLHLLHGGRVEVTFTEKGEVEVKYLHRGELKR